MQRFFGTLLIKALLAISTSAKQIGGRRWQPLQKLYGQALELAMMMAALPFAVMIKLKRMMIAEAKRITMANVTIGY